MQIRPTTLALARSRGLEILTSEALPASVPWTRRGSMILVSTAPGSTPATAAFAAVLSATLAP